MRILQVIPNYLPGVYASGVSGPMHSLIEGLVKMGIDVTVYTTNLDGKKLLDVPLEQEVVLDGVNINYFPITYKPWYYSAALHKALARNVKNFDLIHISSVFLSASALGAYYAKKAHKPYIISPHGSLMIKPLKYNALKKKVYLNLIEKRNLIGAAAIHFTSKKEEEEYLAAGFSIPIPIPIPYSFNAKRFPLSGEPSPGIFREKFNISQNKKIIIFLSRISWKKGLDTLIPAFAEVIKKEPEAVLIIAGPDDEGYRKNVQSLMSNFQLQGKVIFTGLLLVQDKIAAYRDADVFVLPSYSENFGMAVAEAMHMKLPVVITPEVGISDIVKEAGTGLVVEKNINQVAYAILKILENTDEARAMGELGNKLVKKEFSCNKIAEKFAEEYQRIINDYKLQ